MNRNYVSTVAVGVVCLNFTTHSVSTWMEALSKPAIWLRHATYSIYMTNVSDSSIL